MRTSVNESPGMPWPTPAPARRRGASTRPSPEDIEPYLWREAVLRDPSGNRIKLYHAGENRLNPPWRVERRG